MKKILGLIAVLILVVTLSACTTDGEKQKDDIELMQITITELEMYNGEDGNPAYIAVNGVVYDVTNNEEWTGGTHRGAAAGMDLSDLINDSPHGDDVLGDLTVVGEIVE